MGLAGQAQQVFTYMAATSTCNLLSTEVRLTSEVNYLCSVWLAGAVKPKLAFVVIVLL